MSHENEKFKSPMRFAYYPATVSSISVTHPKQETEHKAKIIQYKICMGVKCTCKEKLRQVADEERLEEIKDKIIGFQNVSILKILEHLEAKGG